MKAASCNIRMMPELSTPTMPLRGVRRTTAASGGEKDNDSRERKQDDYSYESSVVPNTMPPILFQTPTPRVPGETI
ncbi:hypothetical protein SRHO_G00073760 [Serrasalmus rhombeus]